eukprot:Clim_evm30s150 gene=Clim_evmTU30s150
MVLDKEQDESIQRMLERQHQSDVIDSRFGFQPLTAGTEVGWLSNIQPSYLKESDAEVRSSVDFYFHGQTGNQFKVRVPHRPYFYIGVYGSYHAEVSQWLTRKFEGLLADVEVVEKDDLDLKNHLVGIKRTYLKLLFNNVMNLMAVRKVLQPAVRRNIRALEAKGADLNLAQNLSDNDSGHDDDEEDPYAQARNRRSGTADKDPINLVVDLREYDIPHHIRVCIDEDICCGKWFEVSAIAGQVSFKPREDLLEWAKPKVCAFDIETTKLPLRFPDAKNDHIMMISYMIDGIGYLIVNREIVSEDIEDFEYTPKPEYQGLFKIFNEANEQALLRRWFDHMQSEKPTIYVTYNGDFFDWPFIDERAKAYGISMHKEIGYGVARGAKEYLSRYGNHMDCFSWVQRDSYLPQGSQGLKAVTKAKLGYDPLELDPEDMAPFAQEKPQVLARYSVSDAVCTYYLYKKYVEPFIFALCTIIPMEPDSVLRKGSGTLCETLLMVQAYRASVIMPNKHHSGHSRFHNNHMLQSETYVGGHVECLEAGVFRNDIPCRFNVDRDTVERLIDEVEETLVHCCKTEMGVEEHEITNLQEAVKEVVAPLQEFCKEPNRKENPLIYHLDVGAMYPNIILTNRLQPTAMVNDEICAACDFNRPANQCQRKMVWTWRGDYYSATTAEVNHVRSQLETERFVPEEGGAEVPYLKLHPKEQQKRLRERVQQYSHKAYKKAKITSIEPRENTVCMRENSFYIDTVRAFRDRRYEYKGMVKQWKKKFGDAVSPTEKMKANTMVILYDSLQLAHKCILNSFYGYVMRKGARWYSMEMAGIVCLTGATIITRARELVEKVGRPLELDTDGIWCILPGTFPQDVDITTTNPKKPKVRVSYPAALLNKLVFDGFTNHQYQTLVDRQRLKYEMSSENSIFFEVDGPYKAMILPASKVEDQLLKKRYAVFNLDGSLAELKGFELKRRGELKLIKIFQGEVFEVFLQGHDLQTCYQAVGAVADRWLNVLVSKASTIEDDELIDLISENKNMSRQLSEYEGQKSTSITTARRLAEFLGDEMVKDAGLNCKYIVSKKPHGVPVTMRAVPVAIFQADEATRNFYLRRWLKDPRQTDFDIRTVLDWDYYIERLGSTIQKIITIPAALQRISNPVPRVAHPDWLYRRIRHGIDHGQQRSLKNMLQEATDRAPVKMADIEEFGSDKTTSGEKMAVVTKRRKPQNDLTPEQQLLRLGPVPDENENPKAWLLHMKVKWRLQLRVRKRRRVDRMGGAAGVASMARSLDVSKQSGFASLAFHSRDRTLQSCMWHVLSAVPSENPGVFDVWVVAGGQPFKVSIDVPRVIYYNHASEEPYSPEHVPINRALPHQKRILNLYKLQTPEEEYQKQLAKLELLFADPTLEGVYETQIDPNLRFNLFIGNRCSLRREKLTEISTRMSSVYQRDDLQSAVTDKHEQNYLEGVDLHRIYINHTQSPAGGHGLYGLVMGKSAVGHIYIVDTRKGHQPLSGVQSVWQQTLGDAGEQIEQLVQLKGCNTDGAIKPQKLERFEVQTFKTHREALRSIQQQILNIKDQPNKSRIPTIDTIFLESGTLTTEQLYRSASMLREMPLVRLEADSRDSQYASVGWEAQALRTFFQSVVVFELEYHELMKFSNACHVPLGHWPRARATYGMDMEYSRRLDQAGQMLWISYDDHPDLGNPLAEHTSLITTHGQVKQRRWRKNVPGGYHRICLDLRIHNLLITAIMGAFSLDESEALQFADKQAISLDAPSRRIKDDESKHLNLDEAQPMETADAIPAFRVLQQLIQEMFKDTVRDPGRSHTLRVMLGNLESYLRDKSALLHDPALTALIDIMARQCLDKLLIALRKLGAVIVHATTERIVIASHSFDFDAGVSYLEHIKGTLHRMPRFRAIELELDGMWDYLLWMDPNNYGGVQYDLSSWNGSLSRTPRPTQGTAPVTTTEPPSKLINLRWNIERYLPLSLQNNFNEYVETFIRTVYETRETIQEHGMAAGHSEGGDFVRQDQRNASLDLEASQLQKWVTEQLADVLCNEIPVMNRMLKADHLSKVEQTAAFPVLPGSHLPLNDPTLELVKSVCHVLMLDKRITKDMQSLKNSLLLQMDMRQFSDEVVFRNPCMSFEIKNVVCQSCQVGNNIDICSDFLTDEETGQVVLACRYCETPFDLAVFDYLLCEQLNDMLAAYQTQDLECSKCHLIATSHLAKTCTCSAPLRARMRPKVLRDQFRVLDNVANFYNFQSLKESVGFVRTYGGGMGAMPTAA